MTTKPRLLVACHDAGGAEVVSSWVRRHREEWDPAFVLDGPAVEIFRQKLNAEHSEPRIDQMDFVLCGSSSRATRFERSVVFAAWAAGVRCAVYLDHWTNYAERFDQLPDEVWVCDEYAEKIAREELPGANVIVKGNPYLEDIVEEVQAIDGSEHNGHNLLYVAERDETEARLPFFGVDDALVIRRHPADAASETTLAEDIAWADVVYGKDSMALVAALKAGRRVISLLPASESHLPFPEIERPFG